MQQPDPVFIFKHTEAAHSVAFSNQTLLVGTENGTLVFFCLSSLRATYEMKVGNGPIVFVSTKADSLYTYERGGVLKIWELEKSGYKLSKEIVLSYVGFARPQHLHSEERNFLIAPSSESDFSVIDLNSGNELQKVEPPKDVKKLMCLRAVWLKHDYKVLAGYETGHLVIFDLKQSKALQLLKFDFGVATVEYDQSRGLASGPDNVTVCNFGIDKENLELFRNKSDDITYVPKLDDQILAGISVIKSRPDRIVFIVGTVDGYIYVHSHQSMRKFATLKNHKAEITDIAFSPGIIDNFKKNIMACSSLDGSISLWNIYYK